MNHRSLYQEIVKSIDSTLKQEFLNHTTSPLAVKYLKERYGVSVEDLGYFLYYDLIQKVLDKTGNSKYQRMEKGLREV